MQKQILCYNLLYIKNANEIVFIKIQMIILLNCLFFLTLIMYATGTLSDFKFSLPKSHYAFNID